MKATATTVHKLVQGSKVFLIPTFQRRYTWRKPQWEQLWEDVLAECEIEHPNDPETLFGHFLGSVVLHPAPGAASTLMRHQVIDGQQRLTTILILLSALRDVRTKTDPSWPPAAIDDQYLRNPFSADYPSRLVPTRLDREAFEKTVRDRQPIGDIGMAYNYFYGEIEKAAQSPAELQRLEDTILLHMLVVEITTKSGDSVSSIFNTLNSKGLELSPADLVRNELLHHLGDKIAESAHDELWVPMELALVNNSVQNRDREFVTFLWSREVAIDPKTSRDNLFAKFERRLRDTLSGSPMDERPERSLAFLREMYDDHLLFRIVRDPSRANDSATISAELQNALQSLKDWRAEPATPIALWVLTQATRGQVSQDDAARTITVLLNYLVKRTLGGIPTNQLNRLLTPIASELSKRPEGTPLQEQLRQLLSKPSYYWPSDDQIRSAALSNPLYASARRYVPFLLGVAEERLPGKEYAIMKKLQIEHIMPQNLSDEWLTYLKERGVSSEEAESLVHTLGNLTLTDNNQSMGNSLFEAKSSDFYQGSALRLNRALSDLEEFTPDTVMKRTEQLVELLLQEFDVLSSGATEEAKSNDSGASADDRLIALLQSLPVDNWVAEEDLVASLGVTINAVQTIVSGLDATLARLVRNGSGNVPEWLGSDIRLAIHQQDDAQGPPKSRLGQEELNTLTQGSGESSDEDVDLEVAGP